MLLVILQWYVTVQLVSAATLALCQRVFRSLPDSGYFFSKSFGVFSIGLIFWLANVYFVLDSSRLAAYIALGITAVLAFAVANNGIKSPLSFFGQQISWIRRNARLVVLSEVIFALGFLTLIGVRMFDAAANHTEQPMDMTMLSGIWWGATFPPEDPWLAGYPISYYYLGYWLLATLGKLSGQPPNIAFNMGQAVWYGLLLVGVFGVGYNLGHLAKPPKKCSLSRLGIVTGAISALVVGVASNLQGAMEWFYAQGLVPAGVGRWFGVRGFPEDAQVTGTWFVGYDWWWWRSSRVISDSVPISGDSVEIITEFPAFSYLLGDLHPHLLAMPFTALVVALALNVILSNNSTDPTLTASNSWKLSLPEFIGAVLLGFIIGLNSWDFPACLLVVLGTVWISTPGEWPRKAFASIKLLTATVLVTLIFYWPYLLTAESQIQGLSLNFFNPTQFRQLLLVLGPFAFFVPCLMLWARRISGPIPKVWFIGSFLFPVLVALFLLITAKVSLETAEVTAFLSRWGSAPFVVLLAGCALAMIVALAVRTESARNNLEGEQRLPTLFCLLLTGIGLLLILAPEVFYVADYFNSRMNTLFKLHYQSWLMLGLGSSLGVVLALSRRGFLRQFASLALVVLAVCLVFTPAAVRAKISLDTADLDAMTHLGTHQRSMINWILKHVPPGKRVLEAVGDSYDAGSNRFSTFTGRPTLLGWPGHEVQWRGSHYSEYSAGREDAIKVIYSSGNPTEIARAVADWNIDYVVVGPRERIIYQMDEI
ncbi:MAG TPA: DUF2298 domain-containing protein, partial [Acidobacteriota bacterium]|nr:DUF2298 domain-containing protein [Acidobacteriota bacterium]